MKTTIYKDDNFATVGYKMMTDEGISIFTTGQTQGEIYAKTYTPNDRDFNLVAQLIRVQEKLNAYDEMLDRASDDERQKIGDKIDFYCEEYQKILNQFQ